MKHAIALLLLTACMTFADQSNTVTDTEMLVWKIAREGIQRDQIGEWWTVPDDAVPSKSDFKRTAVGDYEVRFELHGLEYSMKGEHLGWGHKRFPIIGKVVEYRNGLYKFAGLKNVK